MKKRLVFLVVTILATINVASAQGVWIGPHMAFQKLQIQNATSLDCSFVAYGDIFGNLAPGQTAYLGPGGKKSGKHRSFLSKIISFNGGGFGDYARSDNVSIPIVGLCFDNAAHEHYLGEVDTVLNIPGGGYSFAMTWIVRPSDIKCLDETPCSRPLTTNSAFGEKRFGIPFPTFWMNGMNAVQIVNNSRYPLLLRTTVKFGDAKWIRPGEIYYQAMWGLQAISVKIDATDPANGAIIGAWEQTFYGQYNGVYAQNIVLNRGSFH